MIDVIATQLKALAHPQRLRLFQLIRSGCFCCYVAGGPEGGKIGSRVGDLAREFELAPSTVSHHLKELRTAGLVDVARRGQFLFCRVREDALERLVAYLREAPAPVSSAPVLPNLERES